MIKLWKQIAFDMKDFSLRAYELIEHDISGDPIKKYKTCSYSISKSGMSFPKQEIPKR